MWTWIKKHPFSIVGGLGCIPGIFPAIKLGMKKLLETAEHIDFISNHWNDIVGIRSMIEQAPSPPQWIGVPLLFAGMILIWWDLRRRKGLESNVTSVPISTRTATPQRAHEPALPPNAKFQDKGIIYWVATRQYSPDEAKAIGILIRDLFNLVNTRISKITASYDGTLVMFTREWMKVIELHGTSRAIENLSEIDAQLSSAMVEINEIIFSRDPFYRSDVADIASMKTELSAIRSAIYQCQNVLRFVPDMPSRELMELSVTPAIKSIESAINDYYQWASGFNTRCEMLKGKLSSLINA
jgi:hypothetical protein